ncbi:unnamed protein product [Hermetia illucens]|uniref:Uncharacterized protein n=1 Tax=Hermetia illucens TaxID=343691 RepID=A0A7R8UTA6_HERIL|nr:proline-rich protein 36 [Hermetia illucens]CAD7086606.1 unnamed protein product [Hermetia illucens]
MKAGVITFVLFYIHQTVHAEDVIDQNQKLKEQQSPSTDPFQYQKLSNDFRLLGNRESSGDTFDFNVDDNLNEIPRGPFYPMYQPLVSAPAATPSTQSTHLKQVPPSSNNFSPMMNMNSPTPVIMQYMPQGVPTAGVQYLQLIPTRPLLVPISPYVGQNSAGYSSGFTYPLTSSLTSSIPPANSLPSAPSLSPSYATFASGATLSLPAPSISPAKQFQQPIELNYPLRSPPPPLNTNLSPPDMASLSSPQQASLSQNYRYIRPNSGLQVIDSSPDLTLNLNEYMPKMGPDNIGGKGIKGRR